MATSSGIVNQTPGPNQPTVPTLLSIDQVAHRLADLFPPGWAAEDAKLPGGVLYGLLAALGTPASAAGGPLSSSYSCTSGCTIGQAPFAFTAY